MGRRRAGTRAQRILRARAGGPVGTAGRRAGDDRRRGAWLTHAGASDVVVVDRLIADALVNQINPKTGRVHTTFAQTITSIPGDEMRAFAIKDRENWKAVIGN